MSDVLSDWKLTAFHQKFALPEHFVFYIAKNLPSPVVFNKLIKCCKYFWLKNPIITFNGLTHQFNYELGYWHAEEINGFRNETQFEMENVNKKLWIYGTLSVFDHESIFLASSIIPKIHKCDLSCLNLSYQNITFADFKMFTSSDSMRSLFLLDTSVKKDDGTVITIEQLIEVLPNLRTFQYSLVPDEEELQSINSETAAKLVALPHFPNIEYLQIYGIPETFDIDAFFETPKVSN